MATLLQQYERVVGTEVIDQLWQLARLLDGMHIVHINSTRAGGGVAEILHRIIPLKHELGIDTTWETITGDADFFQCTKLMHNTLQGNRIDIPDLLLRHYENINTENATRLKGLLEDADIVFIHDPQPAAMIESIPSGRVNGSGGAISMSAVRTGPCGNT